MSHRGPLHRAARGGASVGRRGFGRLVARNNLQLVLHPVEVTKDPRMDVCFTARVDCLQADVFE